ncbi:hypothetical protein Taro_049482 [Colocasia esculenta]|uniref:Uncharacterized protein n=1 Tax=Colocasia esculenta TaxID=4460 RepID=A0A843XAW7_COLES|nr:hypothetical protein [Colocasia esculenta]
MLCVPALADGPSGGFRKRCPLEGLSARQVVTVTSDPQPRTSVSERVVPGGGRAQVTDIEQKEKTVGTAAEVRHGAALQPDCGVCGCVLCFDSLASLYQGGCRFLVALACTVVAPNCCFGNPFLGAVCGGTVGCSGRAGGETVLLTWLLGVSRGDTWLFLPNLVEIRDVGACVMRLWSHAVASVFRELLFASACVDSAGFAGAVFGLTRVVVKAFLSFRCFFLLLWLVASFPTWSECELQESVAAVAGCACCERGCGFTRVAVRFVLGLRIRVVVNSGEVLLEFFSVGSGGKLFAVVLVGVPLPLGLLLCSLKSSTVLPPWFEVFVVWLVSVALPSSLRLRYAVVVLAVAFWWVFPERHPGGSGGDKLSTVPVGQSVLQSAWVPSVKDFVSPQGREVGFVSRTLWALLDGSLVSAMGVWLVVLLWKCQSRSVVSPCVWKRLICTVETFVAKVVVTYSPVSCCAGFLSPNWTICALEALVAVGCVALPTCGGRSGALCLLWRVLPVSHAVSVVGATVLHLAEFWCLWWHPLLVLECFVFVSYGALVHCVALWVAPGACVSTVCCVVALSVVRQALVVVVVVSESFPLALGSKCVQLWYPASVWVSFEVDMLSLTFAVVSFPVQFTDVLSCLALPTSDVSLGFVSKHVLVERLVWHSLCGKVVVATTEKSRCDSVVPLHLLFSQIEFRP